MTETTQKRGFYLDVFYCGFPVALQNLLTSSLSFVDSLMISGYSEMALGAVGMAAQWFALIGGCCWGIHGAGTMFFAQYWGARDREGLRRTAWVLFSGVLLVTLPAAVFGLAFPGLIMRMYTNDAQVIAIGQGYLRIAAVSCVFTTLSLGCSGLLRSTGDARLPLYASIASLCTNTLLNWILIYGRLGLPAMGAEGAALATLISSFLNLAVLLIISARRRNILYETLVKLVRPAADFIREYYRKATPIILNEGLYALAALLVNMVFGRQGGHNMSALSLFRTIEGPVNAFYIGFVNATSVIIGNAIGAGRIEDGIRASRKLTLMTVLTTIVVTVSIYLARVPLVSLFGVGEEIRQAAYGLLLVMVLCMPVRFCNWILVGVYRAGGESKMGFYFEIIAIWLLSVPLVSLGGLVWKLSFPVVFALSYSEDFAKLGVQLWYMFSNRWIKPVTEEGRRGLAEYKARA